jgi:ATP-binding cassette subfamily E protein 1
MLLVTGEFVYRSLMYFMWFVLQNPPDWQEILTYFRGSELQNYFTRILEDNLKAIIKPQYVDHIPKAVKGNVGEVLAQKDEREMRFELAKDLDLNRVLDRDVGDLSGGELQRFAIAVVATQHAEIYMFDEPSSYLDVKQRLRAAQVVRSLLRPNRLGSFIFPFCNQVKG